MEQVLLNRIFGEWHKRGWFDVPLFPLKDGDGHRSSSSSGVTQPRGHGHSFSPDISADGSDGPVRSAEEEAKRREQDEADARRR